MADALLTVLFKQLASTTVELSKEEIKLLVGVDEEVQKLQDKLGFIMAMMDDAEERHAVKQRTDKLWLEQLQDQYYEMDDVLDAWSTARIKAEIEKEQGIPAHIAALAVVKKVCSLFLSCCFDLPLRHDLGDHKIKKLNEKLDEIFNNREKYGIAYNGQPEVVERLITTSFVDESNIIGRDNYREELLSNLLGVGSPKERKPRVISLVGMGGLGKTTLAQIAYNDSKVKEHFVKRMWVCVSDPFDQCKVAKAIIESLKGESPNATELQSLLGELCSLIGGKRFFLVLDDVWARDSTKESEKWEPFKNVLTCGAQGSKILVTTRNEEVAHMMGSAKTDIIKLENLSVEHSWLIIKKNAFFDDNIDQDLEPLGRQLAVKCNGLPLAAKLIGGYMWDKRSKEEWVKVLESSLLNLEISEGLLGPLLLSYYELSPAEKQCFLFCAVFPKDHVINRFELIIHWMAQGYIDSKGNMEMEDVAEEYFKKLAMRSFLQDFEEDEMSSKIKSCKLHDIVHDFAQSVRINECLEINADKNLEIDCKRLRHLSLGISKEMQIPEHVVSAKNLRTLFLRSHERDRVSNILPRYSSWDYEFDTHLFDSCHHYRYLRTLILDCPCSKLPDEVENLIHLRFFHMYKNVKIEKLPETFCNLCNLQTLNIDNIQYFEELPQGIGKLINLRQLRFYTKYKGWYKVEFPNGIGKLTCLRTLSDFNICGEEDREGCKLGELNNLNQLRGSFKMNRLGNVVDVGEAQNVQLKKKIHLHNLELNFFVKGQLDSEYYRRMENDRAVLNALEPPSHLEKLSITWFMSTTLSTNWMTSLAKLKSLHIDCCYQLKCLPPLGKLPLLETLYIQRAKNVRELGDEFLEIESENKSKKLFPNLRVLVFDYLERWEEWIGMGGKRLEMEEEKDSGSVSDPIVEIMPRVESLTIKYCTELKCLPDYLRTTPLQKLCILHCPILKHRCESGDYRPIISHIPTIRIL